MKNALITPVMVLLVIIGFSSCEAFIHAGGKVYDCRTNQPVSDVSVILLWYKRMDTMTDCGFIVDSISMSERRKMRRNGIKDNYKDYSFGDNKWATRAPVFTDTAGKFTTGTFWVSAAFGIPKTSILLTSPGYKPVVVPNNYGGSIIYLEPDN